jgi:Sulfotransferase family/SEC-C motif
MTPALAVQARVSSIAMAGLRDPADIRACMESTYRPPLPVRACFGRWASAAMNQGIGSEYPFDRPVIVVSAPRSGSTLLFETLARSGSLWTIGDESHGVFEHIKQLNPAHGICTSNRLLAEDAEERIVGHLRAAFLERLRNHAGLRYRDVTDAGAQKPRLLEKTPKNALRIPFLDRVFPDARYIWLYRDPRENLSSMIEAWRSSDFVTYKNLPGWTENWSLLLPPGFQRVAGSPLEEVVAFQWQSANRYILNDLAAISPNRWTALSYAELVADTPVTVKRLCEFADVAYDEGLDAWCRKSLPLSRYTRTAPKTGKWRVNQSLIERMMPGLQPLIDDMQNAVARHSSSSVLQTGVEPGSRSDDRNRLRAASRNERCGCGSGLRYKHCHGKL